MEREKEKKEVWRERRELTEVLVDERRKRRDEGKEQKIGQEGKNTLF